MKNYLKIFSIFFLSLGIFFAIGLFALKIIFQGTEDKIVPPSQAEIMAEGLREKKIPFSLIMYEGEQHGFRQSKNIISSLESELYFYSQVLGFVPFDQLNEINIENSENLKK